MAYDVEDEVIIDRSLQDVWRWVVEDSSREQQWRNLGGMGVRELEMVSDGPAKVGSRFRGTVKAGPGRPKAYVNELTALEPPRLVSWETVDAEGALGGRGNYRLTPLGNGERTRFRIELDYPARNVFGKFLRPMMRLAGPLMISKMLAKLKRLVEGDSPPAADRPRH